MNFKRSLAGGLLLTVPIIAVSLVRDVRYGNGRPTVDAAKAREFGDFHAKVVIVEYSDFQCPVCAQVDPSVHRLLQIYQGQIRLIYKYYPLARIHKNAIPAAHAAECAASQDQFWPYHDRLFQTQCTWATLPDPTTSFIAIAKEINLDFPKFHACYIDLSTLVPIERDTEEARRRHVLATPTFFVNDERLVGYAIETEGAQTIECELKRR